MLIIFLQTKRFSFFNPIDQQPVLMLKLILKFPKHLSVSTIKWAKYLQNRHYSLGFYNFIVCLLTNQSVDEHALVLLSFISIVSIVSIIRVCLENLKRLININAHTCKCYILMYRNLLTKHVFITGSNWTFVKYFACL